MTVERDEMIVRDYLDHRGLVAICREHNIGDRRVFQILKAAGVKRRRKNTGELTKPLSQVHLRIGQSVYDHYFKRGMDRRMAANKLGMSSKCLRLIELGVYQLTLFDIQDLAGFIGKSVGDLVDGR